MLPLKQIVLSLGVLVLAIVPAMATPITGTINLAGNFQPVTDGVATQNMAKADGIDFLPLGGSEGSFVTLAGTGSLAIFANASGGVIKDFSFDLFSPVNTFYSITVAQPHCRLT
jgi:hypothetical protein